MTTDWIILETSLYTSELVLIVLTITIFSSYRRQSPDFRWLAWFVGISLLVDVIAEVFYWVHINTNYTGTVYKLVSMPLLSTFFYSAIRSTKLKAPLIMANVVYVILAGMNFLLLQGMRHINSYTAILEAIIVIALSIIFFHTLLQRLPTQQIQRLPLFWIVSGLFLSYAGKLVIYSVQHYLVYVLEDSNIIVQTFHNILSLVCYSLILLGVIVKARNDKKTGPPVHAG